MTAPNETPPSMYEMFRSCARKFPRKTAIDFMGKTISYAALLEEADICAAALEKNHLRAGDTVLLVLPNIPQAVVFFYGLNKIGATVSLAHPLSSPEEMRHYLTVTGARWVVAADMFYERFKGVFQGIVEKIIVTSIGDRLPLAKKLAYLFAKGGETSKIRQRGPVVFYKNFLNTGRTGARDADGFSEPGKPDGKTPAVVLFSGGSTAMPKGVSLSSAAFNALAGVMAQVTECRPEDSILTILPVFHGFGLGICIHTPLCAGLKVILVPQFSADTYIRCLRRHNPSYIAGVPTLFQAMLQHKDFSKVSFTHLRGAYCGGDSLPAALKRNFDKRLMAQGSPVELMEGYGLTECVTACVVSPRGAYHENSAGLPAPGIRIKIVEANPELLEPGKRDGYASLPPDQVGEICVTGPTLMSGYLNDAAGTAEALREHPDGNVWLHTGDLGCLDADGYLYFKGRIKRLIKVSGIAVYPAQVEHCLEEHPLVSRAAVIGVHDPYKMSHVKAFVTLKDASYMEDVARELLFAYCREKLNTWAAPREIEFRSTLPLTAIGKINYKALVPLRAS